MVPQEVEIIGRLQSGESPSVTMASYNIGLDTERLITILYVIKGKCKGPSKVTEIETA